MSDKNKEACRRYLNEVMNRRQWSTLFKDPTSTPWVILVDGHRVKLSSGKDLWKQISHAKCAMLNELSASTYPGYRESIYMEWHRYESQVSREWIADHVEYITLTEWIARGRP